jgi:hypothetical protein
MPGVGDPVETPRGPGVVAGIYTEPVRWHPRSWLIVELDSGERGLIEPGQARPAQLRLELPDLPVCPACGAQIAVARFKPLGDDELLEADTSGTIEVLAAGRSGEWFALARELADTELGKARARAAKGGPRLYRRHVCAQAA